MGATVVARVEGAGFDALKVLSDRLLRDYQASALERWACIIRSYRQATPPSDLALISLNNESQNESGTAFPKGLKQRAMYTLRHSAVLTQIVVMVEDKNAPTRSSELKKQKDSLKNDFAKDQTEKAAASSLKGAATATTVSSQKASSSPPQNQDSLGVALPIAQSSSADQKTPAADQSESEASTPGDEPLSSLIDSRKLIKLRQKSPEVILPRIGFHFRTSVLAVPESFELLISTTLCSTHAIRPPSSWAARPSIVLIEGKVWALYSDPMGSGNLSSERAWIPETSNSALKPNNSPDWLLRMGTVTNKGTATANTSLPWIVLELEYLGADELSPDSTFLENLLKSIVRPNDKMFMKLFRPTEEDLIDAGLETDDSGNDQSNNGSSKNCHLPQPNVTRRSGYCLLMLAKQEGLI